MNTPTGSGARTDGWQIRRAAVAHGIPCLTTLAAGVSAARAISRARQGGPARCCACRSCTGAGRRSAAGAPTRCRDGGLGALRPAAARGRRRRAARRLPCVARRRPEGPAPAAGQFAMLAAAERWGGGQDERPYLPRAFSYARWRAGEAHFLLEDVGPGTRRLCELRAGEGLWLLGPLGSAASRRPPAAAARCWSAAASASRRSRSGRTRCWGAGPGGERSAKVAGARSDGERGLTAALLGFRDARRARRARACWRRRRSRLTTARWATTDSSPSCSPASSTATLTSRSTPAGRRRCWRRCGRCARRAPCPPSSRWRPAWRVASAPAYGCVVPRRGGGYLRVCIDGPVIDAAELEHVDAHAGAPA